MEPVQTRLIEAYPVRFSGTGSEFFRVWIVNLLLGILTLGFYTPFARRRTAQYFYSHTLVAGSPLEFVAQQRKMTLGFLLLVALYAAFRIASNTGQDTVVLMFLAAAALLAPYFWGSAMRFRLNATRWRGIRLQFTATWGEVYRASWPVYVIALLWFSFLAGVGALGELHKGRVLVLAAGAGLLGVFAGGFLCLVRLEFNYKSLLVARARIGGQPGRWKPVYRDFLGIWLRAAGIFILCAAGVAALLLVLFGASFAMLYTGTRTGLVQAFTVIAVFVGAIFLMFLASAPARAYRQARVFQLVWNNVGVSSIARFKSDLPVRSFVWLRVRNMLFGLLTLGFYRPFAMVAEYRMRADSVTLHVKGGLEQLAGQLAREEQGLGDAIADAVGLDLVG